MAAFIASTGFAGQSLVVSGSTQLQVSDPALAPSQSWRVEFQIHNWAIPPAGIYSAGLFQLAGTGVLVRIYPDGTLEIESADPVTQRAPCFAPLTGITNGLVRVQKNAPSKLFSCEIWNYDGSGYRSQVLNISDMRPKQSDGVIGMGASAALGFLRVSATLMAMGARPPTTADGGDWTELKFDGNLKDSSSRNHKALGSASYMQTPNQVAFAFPKTIGAPAWSSWTSLRAGFPAQLDGSASYSLADASSTVSCVWQETAGPSNVFWTNQNTPTPTIDGLIFGTYDFTLRVTDSAGSTASAPIEVGAVATDDNGVVVNADPNVDKIFGPMIAFGKNPWGYADERALAATKLRMAAYKAQGLAPPPWVTARAGTVTYAFNGHGPSGQRTTRIAHALGQADMTIQIEDAAFLDLSTLPTRILLGNFPREEVRICAASAMRGSAALTVCYDGRGPAPGDGYARVPAQDWPPGTLVGQMKVAGSGTRFLSTICTPGPGPTGVSSYATGSLQLTAGSTAVAGIGTAWTTANGVNPGYAVRVTATHNGAPFLFTAYIGAVGDSSHLTLTRPYPADADSGSFSYSILQADTRQITLHYKRADGTEGQTYFQTSGCESDTEAYLYLIHDIPSLNGKQQTGMPYSYMDGFGYTSAFGANFYGEDLAHRALYYRSGWTTALDAARVMGDNYVTSPQVDGGDVGGIPLLIGGGVIGGFAAAILDTTDPNRPDWHALRGLARNGSIGSTPCYYFDTRDSGYLESWLTLAAEFDPDPAQRKNWLDELQRQLTRDQRCKGNDNSWANGFLWNNSSAALKLTNGSAVATGNNIPQSMCFGIASGMMSVANESATGLGSGFVAGNKIVITGTRNGAPYTGFFQFAVNKDGSVTLGALWPGDSGQAAWMIENSDNLTTIGISNADPQLTKNWACKWNSPGQITLNRPWDGPTESGAHTYSAVLAGFGQQPYMLGIKITQMKFASEIEDSPAAGAYGALAADAARWIHDTGYDPVTQGLFYGKVMQACEPATTPPPAPLFAARSPGCDFGLDPGWIRTGRVLTAEASQALRVYYESNPTPEARAWGDRAYGSVWGNPLYTTGGVYADLNYVRDENSNTSLGAYKWTGFFFGMGMSHQWPAVRLGGVAAPSYRQVAVDLKPDAAAAKVQVKVTAPSGAVKLYICDASKTTCEVTVDDRQGAHQYRVQSLSTEGKVVAESAPVLIPREKVAPRHLAMATHR
ncbi:MAG TPA: hypothetical protein VG297_00365 [Bryobacteraceae bacterium]|nr:hypothetical protein [Bryobacteraceae bacterium]